MHRVWDSGLLARHMQSAGVGWRGLGGRLQGATTAAERREWRDLDPVVWVDESYAIATSPGTRYVGGGAEPLALSERYYRENLPVLLRRLRQAGYRLARLLDGVLGGD